LGVQSRFTIFTEEQLLEHFILHNASRKGRAVLSSGTALLFNTGECMQ